MKYYILFGPPGAGKGTQAKKIITKFNYLHLSTGDLLRGEIKKGSKLGKNAAFIIEQGNLVPDEIVADMIKKQFEAHKNDVDGFLLDGFPRTKKQAVMLDKILFEMNQEVTQILSLHLDDKYIFDRIFHRAQIEGRKDDTKTEVIQNRIDTYHSKTEPLISYYKKQDKYFEIDGLGTIDEIFEKISKIF
ncbi:MAG: adenylate kinase [Bacteroidales bacterium]